MLKFLRLLINILIYVKNLNYVDMILHKALFLEI